MIIYLKSIIFGVVQGITEFLPVSSSAHLALLHKIFLLPIENELAFDVALHFATLIAVVFYFIENRFRGILTIAVMLVLIGILFILSEKFSAKLVTYKNLNWFNAFLIGCAQAIALIPGTSRSGITIIAGLFSGLQREKAVRFSFLLSIPIIFGAFIKKIPQIAGVDLSGNEMRVIIFAGLSAFFAAFYAISYFIKFTKNKGLQIFFHYFQQTIVWEQKVITFFIGSCTV